MITTMNNTISEEIFECPLCTCLLFEPIVTTCGHTFCRSCILRGMDHQNKCPLCRTVIYVTPESGICAILQQTIQQFFPEKYEERRLEVEGDKRAQHFQLPLFLLGELVLFPGMPLPLHIFEPRYRLMIRRCLEGGRKFGIVASVNGKLATIGTTAVIDEYKILPDGRSLVSTTGGNRFQIKETHVVDDYTVATVEYLEDENTENHVNDTVLQEKFEKLKSQVTSKFQHLSSQIEENFGSMPTTVGQFTYWVSAVLPFSAKIKVEILSKTTALERCECLLANIPDDAGCQMM
eukprot:TRINITY_DN6615_c0_g1_i1.p1 TRINITY_DN6615_c0_g1~~TRINITY_DN6615_c0_g1_i1.p1  ORF type:complete len:292 (+),score=42.59 TRINITY_DN6615_c0_g1_i1:46-921(+)